MFRFEIEICESDQGVTFDQRKEQNRMLVFEIMEDIQGFRSGYVSIIVIFLSKRTGLRTNTME